MFKTRAPRPGLLAIPNLLWDLRLEICRFVINITQPTPVPVPVPMCVQYLYIYISYYISYYISLLPYIYIYTHHHHTLIN